MATLQQGEPSDVTIMVLRKHYRALISPIVWTVIWLMVTLAVMATLAVSIAGRSIALIFAALLILRLINVVLAWRTSTCTVTTRQLLFCRGWVSKSTDSIQLLRVTKISTHSSLLDRAFGCGGIIIDHGGPRAILRAIPNPEKVREALERLVQEEQNRVVRGGF